MKKFVLLSFSIALLGACETNEETSNGNKNDNTVTERVEVEEKDSEVIESEYTFPSNTSTVGDASIVISTPSGTSEEGNVPTLFVGDDDALIQIGIDLANFDGSKETFIYINEVFNTSEQVGELTQTSLNLTELNLEPGEYTVTAIQFVDNDPTKEPINLTEATYKIEKAS